MCLTSCQVLLYLCCVGALWMSRSHQPSCCGLRTAATHGIFIVKTTALAFGLLVTSLGCISKERPGDVQHGCHASADAAGGRR